jgi:hypothetical protein
MNRYDLIMSSHPWTPPQVDNPGIHHRACHHMNCDQSRQGAHCRHLHSHRDRMRARSHLLDCSHPHKERNCNHDWEGEEGQGEEYTVTSSSDAPKKIGEVVHVRSHKTYIADNRTLMRRCQGSRRERGTHQALYLDCDNQEAVRGKIRL